MQTSDGTYNQMVEKYCNLDILMPTSTYIFVGAINLISEIQKGAEKVSMSLKRKYI